jgi:quercetin dioxygenase-like cupin family protein
MTKPSMHIPAEGGERISFMGMDLVWKLNKDRSSTLMTFMQIAPVGGGVPLHIHHNEDESIFVVEGSLMFQVGDEKFEVKKGGTVYMPKGTVHGFRITGDEPAHILFILDLMPESKYEEMFNGLVGLGPNDFDKIKEVTARNAVEFLTPPQMP